MALSMPHSTVSSSSLPSSALPSVLRRANVVKPTMRSQKPPHQGARSTMKRQATPSTAKILAAPLKFLALSLKRLSGFPLRALNRR